MDIMVGLGLAMHAVQASSALPVDVQDPSSTAVFVDTTIATALLLGLVGLVSLVRLLHRRARGARHDG